MTKIPCRFRSSGFPGGMSDDRIDGVVSIWISVHLAKGSFLSRVGEHIESHVFSAYIIKAFTEKLSQDFCTIAKFANYCGISEKKLQRLLSHEGTSFSKILDDYRRTSAFQLLPQRQLPIHNIASQLGYSSSTAFNTACKRWYSKSPTQLRAEFKRQGR